MPKTSRKRHSDIRCVRVFSNDLRRQALRQLVYTKSDVARLRKIVINSLYSHRDVFLRELISNANDALEKLRITSLKEGFHIEHPTNVSIKAIKEDQDGKGRLIITGAAPPSRA